MKSPPKSPKYIYVLMVILTILIIIFFFLSQHRSLPPAPPQTLPITATTTPIPTPIISEKARVTRVIDGDSIVLDNGKEVRYIGINTPEFANQYNNYKPTQCFADEAKKTNTALVFNQEVALVKDTSETDKYGRLLRYVYVDGEMVNDFLIRWGFARLETVKPDTHFALQFKDAQKEAQSNHRGLWKTCSK